MPSGFGRVYEGEGRGGEGREGGGGRRKREVNDSTPLYRWS